MLTAVNTATGARRRNGTFTNVRNRITEGEFVTTGLDNIDDKARTMYFTAARVPASELYRLGVVEACVAPEALIDTAMDFARQIASKSPIAIGLEDLLSVERELARVRERIEMLFELADVYDDYEEFDDDEADAEDGGPSLSDREAPDASDIDEDDLLTFFEQDDNTHVIAQHCEDLKDGRAFAEVAKRVSKKKPVIMLKAGRTSAGAKAASSHTGALAGNDKIYEDVLKQSGVIRARSLRQMLDFARGVPVLPTPQGENVVIITGAGGSGVLLSDSCVDNGLKLFKPMPDDPDAAFRKFIPPFGAAGNPVVKPRRKNSARANECGELPGKRGKFFLFFDCP